eukprot:12936176-Prorocentrum_lima.AAC.1
MFWCCLECKWCSKTTECIRPLEHAIHLANPGFQDVAQQLQSRLMEFTDARKQILLKRHQALGNRTSSCMSPK